MSAVERDNEMEKLREELQNAKKKMEAMQTDQAKVETLTKAKEQAQTEVDRLKAFQVFIIHVLLLTLVLSF